MKKEGKGVSLLQLIGLGGAFFFTLGGFMIAGGNPTALLHVSELVVVVGFTGFSLLAIYRGDFLLFILDALSAFFRRPKSSERFVEIARSGQRYAIASGILAFVLGMICAMSSLGDGLEVFGYKIVAALTGIFMAVILSELIFGFLIKVYQEEKSEPVDKREKSLTIIIFILVVLLTLIFSDFFISKIHSESIEKIHSENIEKMEAVNKVDDASE